MGENLKLLRIKTKLDEMFDGRIDLSDIPNNRDDKDKVFYSRAISALAIVMNCGISVDAAVACITDGYNDMGIDAVYNDSSQKKLYIVQSKWRTDGTGSITQSESNTFEQGVDRILLLDFNGCNSKLEEKIQEITDAIYDMEYQIEMVFCHTGDQYILDFAYRPIKELLNNVNEDDSTELLSFREIRLQDIYDYLANGQQGEDINIDDVVLLNWGVVNEPYKAYYGAISAKAIGDWYSKYGNQLFAKNIRYYKGSTEVNQGIKDVLKNEPDKFFYYNNGIKILCKKITRKAIYSTGRETGLFALEGVSLINGAQTAGAIGSAYAELPKDIPDAQIFILMIDLEEEEEDQATRITKLSNTQNRIEGKDFVSLDPEQERLRMELSLGGIQYLYKSGSKITDKETQISLDEAIVSLACMQSDLSIVATAKRNIGALTENIYKPPYTLLFNKGTNSFTLFNAVLVQRSVDNCIKNNEHKAEGRKRLVLVHGNRFLLHLILDETKNIERFNTQYLTQESINDKVESLFQDCWDSVYNSMEKHFPDAYPAYIYKNVGQLKVLLEE